MSSSKTAEQVVRDTLSGLDEDILEYVLSLIEESGLTDPDTQEQVSAFLQSAGFCEEESQANEITKQLAEKLSISGNSETQANATTTQEDDNELPRLLEAPITFGGDSENSNDLSMVGAPKSLLANRNVALEASEAKLSKRDLRKIKREEERKALQKQRARDAQGAVGLSDIQISSIVGGEDGTAGNVQLSMFDLPNKKGSGPDLLTNASITFTQSRRYGLVGVNGCGKTTFMEAFNNREIDGMKWCKQSILLVRQEVEGNNLTPLEWVLHSEGQRVALKNEIDRLQSEPNIDTAALASLHEQLSIVESTKGEAQAGTMLHNLGFDKDMQRQPTKSLSGGWRRRVALACALFVAPDVLLLDEPTNHLDLETVLWLEQYLTSDNFHATLIVVSHDRSFLNSVVTDIVHFHQKSLQVYKGDYFSFLDTMEQQAITRQHQREAQEMKRAHLQEYITKHAQAGENGPKAARQRKSRMKKLERLGVEAAAQNQGRKFKASYDGDAEDVQEQVDENEFELHFPDPGKVDGTVIRLDDVGFRYNNGDPENNAPMLLRDISFNFDVKSRVALLGKNGSGKSTLLKLIMGLLEPSTGLATLKQNCRIEYIAQHHAEELDLDSCPLEVLLERFPGDHSMGHRTDMRRYLATFGLGGEVLPLQKIGTLSGGQKCRVSLALALYRKPHFLIMDEPTNHLDHATTNALIEAIAAFPGGVAVVSHDEYLLQRICKELYVVKDHTLTRFGGGFEEYKKHILKTKGR